MGRSAIRQGTLGFGPAVRGEVNYLTHSTKTAAAAILAALVIAACGDAPLGSVGQRSSDWINEPEVVTTTVPPVTAPRSIGTDSLLWSNDGIATTNLGDREALVAEVFARREGDRFIQASRAEIAALLPSVRFPATVPYGAEWVSSQLVIENSGALGTDPSAAFGIWSAEPYTRSRSVAQLAILRVAIDPDTASEISGSEDATGGSLPQPSCARFSDQTTASCELLDLNGRSVWNLTSSSGTTLIWFEGDYRYELFGRSFLSRDAIEAMAAETVALSDVTPPTP